MRVLPTVVLVLGLFSVSGCGSKSGSSATSTTIDPASYVDETAQHTVTIDARDDLFTPQYVKVRAGTTIVFENGGRNRHNVISADRSFPDLNTDAFAPGTKKTVRFDQPGEHDFFCSLHGTASNGMYGSVLVVP